MKIAKNKSRIIKNRKEYAVKKKFVLSKFCFHGFPIEV